MGVPFLLALAARADSSYPTGLVLFLATALHLLLCDRIARIKIDFPEEIQLPEMPEWKLRMGKGCFRVVLAICLFPIWLGMYLVIGMVVASC